jgi:hypothetical protein
MAAEIQGDMVGARKALMDAQAATAEIKRGVTKSWGLTLNVMR